MCVSTSGVSECPLLSLFAYEELWDIQGMWDSCVNAMSGSTSWGIKITILLRKKDKD